MKPLVRSQTCAALAVLLLLPGVASALVDGEPHRLYASHRVFGGAIVTGNTMMTTSIANLAVNSGLLPLSSGDVSALPFDAQIVGAYLFWSGSLANRVDREVDFTAADGTRFNDLTADRCVTVPSLGGFFYCRADVTAEVAAHPGAQAFNGRYTVGDLDAEPGFLNPDGTCVDESECQAKYAGWSLVLVYNAASANTLRDIFIHDGFRQLDETPESPGIDQFQIDGFDFPRNGTARLTYFALEGDSFLGVPPQDTDPVFPCANCFDFMDFNGRRLSDANNPPNNLFNSSSPGGYTLGLDLDSFNVSSYLRAGDTAAPIRVGSGDGIIDAMSRDQAGAGESFLLGFVMLVVDRNAPNFQRDGTRLTVIPDEAAPRERVVIRLQLANEGTLDAVAVRARLTLPAGLTYLPGSLRLDGADPVPGAEVQSPLAGAGLLLGNIPYQGDNTREITLQATIDPGVAVGTRFVLQALIAAANVGMDARSNEAILVILGGLDLGQPTKRVTDTNGDDRFVPGEVVRYDIVIPNTNAHDVQGVELVDDLPPYLDLLQVISFGGTDQSDPGRNRVRVTDLVVPGAPGGGTTVTVIARIHDVEQLLADGVPAGGINGFAVDNQAQVIAAGEATLTDDPDTGEGVDPTRMTLSAAIDIAGAQTRKTVVDVNGGRLEPGDTLRYVVQIANTGTAPAEVFVNDPLPPATGNCVLESAQPDLLCAGGRLQGLLTVGPGGRERVTFTVQVNAGVAHDTVIQNVATLRASQQTVEAASERLRVFAAPDLSGAQKVSDAPNGVAVPGQRLTWQITVQNRGNRAATAVTVIDPLTFDFEDVVPLDGGVYDGGTNTVTWQVPRLEPGESFVGTFETALPAQAADGTIIANQAMVSSAETGNLATDDPRTVERLDPTRVTVRSQPLLVLTKAVAPRVAAPGDTVTYTFRVRNAGTDAAPPSTLVDQVPDGVFASVVPDMGAVAGRRLTVPIPALDVGAEVTVRVNATLLPVLPDGVQVRNQAAVELAVGGDSASDDPDTPALDDPTLFSVDSTPALALDKAVIDLNGGLVQPGDRLRYALTLRATGDAPVFEVQVTDAVPAGLVDVAVEGKGALRGGTITWAIPGTVEPGEPVTLAFEATVAMDVAAGGVIANQAQAVGRDVTPLASDDPATVEVGDPTRVTVVSAPDLGRPAKTVEPREARPGDVVTFRIEVRNQGTAPSGPVSVVDPLPAGLLDWEAEPPAQIGDVDARWAVPPLAPGEGVTLTLRARVPSPLADGTVFINQATAQIEGEAPTLTDDPGLPGDADPTALVVRSSPLVAVFKTVRDLDGAPVRPGDRLRYTLVVVNQGDDLARDVVLRDPLIDDLSLADPGTGTPGADGLSWSLGDVAPGTPVEQSFEVTVARGLPNGTRVPNQASVTASNLADPALSDDPATAAPVDPTIVRVVSAADLSEATKAVEDLGDGAFRPGTRVRYTIRFRNVGDAVAEDVVVRDALPAELQDPQPAEGGAIEDGAVVWRIPALRPSEVGTLHVEATLRRPLANGTVVSNQAELSARDIAEPYLTDNPATPAFDATAFTVTSSPRLALTKEIESPGPVRPGQVVTYLLTVRNDGDAPSEPVEVVDLLPEPLAALQVPRPAVLRGRAVSWTVPAVVPGGQPATLRVSGTVPEDAADGTVVSNQALLGDRVSDDPTTAAADDPTDFVVEDRPDLRGAVKSVAGTFEPGGQVVYALEVANLGTRAATNVLLEDLLPEAILDPVLSGADGELDGRTVRVRRATLGPGERLRLEIAGRVADDAADGLVVSNQARVLADGLDAVLTDDPATPTAGDATAFTVVARPALALRKTVRDDDGGGFQPGDPVSYVLHVENTGNRPAQAVEVVDPVDAALANVVVAGGRLEANVAAWTVPVLQPGESVDLELRARLRDDLAQGTEVSNQFGARIGAVGDFQLSEVVTFVIGAGGLTALKTVRPVDGAGFAPGGQVEYAITVRNDGAADQESVFVIDPIDRRALVRVEALDGGVFDPRRGVIEWGPAAVGALRLLPPGREVRLRFRATLSADLQAGERVSNQGQVSARDETPVATDDPSTPAVGDATVLVVGGGPGYQVEKSVVALGDAGFVPGGRAEYTLEITNIGSAAGQGLVLTDVIPPWCSTSAARRRSTASACPTSGGARPSRSASPCADRAVSPACWRPVRPPRCASRWPSTSTRPRARRCSTRRRSPIWQAWRRSRTTPGRPPRTTRRCSSWAAPPICPPSSSRPASSTATARAAPAWATRSSGRCRSSTAATARR